MVIILLAWLLLTSVGGLTTSNRLSLIQYISKIDKWIYTAGIFLLQNEFKIEHRKGKF